jgi:hypothetical protein
MDSLRENKIIKPVSKKIMEEFSEIYKRLK